MKRKMKGEVESDINLLEHLQYKFLFLFLFFYYNSIDLRGALEI